MLMFWTEALVATQSYRNNFQKLYFNYSSSSSLFKTAHAYKEIA